jgi:hypothetical protein
MPEVHDTVNDSDQMLIHSMTEKGEVSFDDECMRLLLNVTGLAQLVIRNM